MRWSCEFIRRIQINNLSIKANHLESLEVVLLFVGENKTKEFKL